MAKDFLAILQEIRGTGDPEAIATDGIWWDLTLKDYDGSVGMYNHMLSMYEQVIVIKSLDIGIVTTVPNLPDDTHGEATASYDTLTGLMDLGLPAGSKGLTGTINVGVTTTLAPGSAATVVNSGTEEEATIDFGIPQGYEGITSTIEVGTVDAVPYPGPATVVNTGTIHDAIFDFELPIGPQGQSMDIEHTVLTVIDLYTLTAPTNDIAFVEETSSLYIKLDTGTNVGASDWSTAIPVTVSGSFIELTDTPSTYLGLAGHTLRVNQLETGLETALLPESFEDLNDTPDSYSGLAGQTIKVKQDETGVEAIDTDPVEKAGDIMTGNLEVPSLSIDGHYVSPYGNKNKIVNGDFSVWQRGENLTGLAVDTFTADKWMNKFAGATATRGREQIDGVGNFNFIEVSNGTANGIFQIIDLKEKPFHFMPHTISFRAECVSGDLYLSLGTVYENGLTHVEYSKSLTGATSLADRQVNTMTLRDSDLSDSVVGYYLNIVSKNGETIKFAEVQVEEGEQATPFETQHHSQTKLECGLVDDESRFGSIDIMDTYSPYSMKNKLINGGFDIWQEDTTFTQTSGSYVNTYTADMWRSGSSEAGVNVTRQGLLGRIVDGYDGLSKYALRYEVDVANDNAGIYQRIESVHTLQGKKATLSFRVANSLMGFKVGVKQNFGTGGTPSVDTLIFAEGVSATTDWGVVTHTFDIPSIEGKTLGTDGNDYLEVSIVNPANELWINWFADIQFEEGSVATPFERLPVAQTLTLCKRYYEEGIDILRKGIVAGEIYHSQIRYTTEKRDLPSVTSTHVASASCTLYSVASETASLFYLKLTGDVTSTDGYYYSTWIADARL